MSCQIKPPSEPTKCQHFIDVWDLLFELPDYFNRQKKCKKKKKNLRKQN